jgi:Ca2+/Na+ antiporter
MDLDELRVAWQSQEDEGDFAMSEDALLDQVVKEQRDFDRKVLGSDMVFVGIGVFLAALCSFYGIMTPIWTWRLAGVLVLAVYTFFLVARMRQRRRAVFHEESLAESAKAYLRQIDYRIWLLRSMLWWYLLPLGTGLVLVWGHMALAQILDSGLQFNAVLFVFPLAVVLAGWCGACWFLLRGIRRELLPRKRKLEALLRSLENEEQS